MTLTQKILGAIVALFLLFGGANYAVQRWVILPSFDRIERAAVENTLTGVEATLRREMSLFETFAADWGNWADTYAYMIDRNAGFLEENMNQATFDANSLDIVGFLDPASNLVWGQGTDPETRAPRRYALLASGGLDPGSPYRAAVAEGRPMQGIVHTELGPAMVVVAPVLDGAGGGPHRGAVLLGRVITADVVHTISEQARVPLRLEVLPRTAGTAATTQAQSSRLQVFADHLVASVAIRDVAGLPAFRLSFEKTRDIVNGGRDAVSFALMSLGIVGLLVLLTLLVTLRHLVLTPVEQVRRFVHSVATSGDLSLRLTLHRKDELGVAARDLNTMVERLAEAQRAIATTSFDAGVGEMARGVLHNIGNALTPVTVHAGRLSSELATLPTRDFAAATEELVRPDIPPERRTRLLAFLQLATDDLQLRASEATQQVGSVLRGLAAIQSILQQQTRFAHSAHVLDKVTPAEIVEHALRLVAPEKLARLDVRSDGSLAAAGQLRLPRIVLEQVAQNLIVNACEAAAPDRRGTLRIAASMDDTPAGHALHLTFTDDGRGIAPEHLQRVFGKGFSTKARDTNSGLGLHWCSNVVHGLGGSVYAESPGPDRGATFHVVVPLEDHARGAVPRSAAA